MSRPTTSVLRALPLSARTLHSTPAPLAAVLPSTAGSSSSSSTSPVPSPTEPTRIYPARKAFLHAYYAHLLDTSHAVLLFSHANLSVADLSKIRRALSKLPPPEGAGAEGGAETKATLTIARTGLLSSLFVPPPSGSTASTTPAPSRPSLLAHLNGPTALLTTPSLSPPYLLKVLSTITRTLKSLKRDVPTPAGGAKGKAAGAGAGGAGAGADKQPTLTLLAGIMEGNRLFDARGVQEVAKLPSIDTLRAQLVGVLEAPPRQLLGVLSQAGGGALVRTLQGLEAGLREGQGGDKGEEAKAE